MKQDFSARQEYYQKIARAFLKHQTSLFFLPPKDVSLISEWEKLGLPLEAILEGIEKTFAKKLAGRRKKKIYSLCQCEREILKAYAQYQDRLAGSSTPETNRLNKVEKARAEINQCLSQLPHFSGSALKKLLTEALDLLKSKEIDESRLEQIDEEIDNLIWESSSPEERDFYLDAARKDYPGKTDRQLQDIQRQLLIKGKRQALKIPYVSLFYH
ncbi:MAG: hypothetical protein H5U07_06065 [Candidatus Aminicenantes bacterium]|nr:hypothetical protein [Candidatus Aminicenantes bacterium]